MKSTRKERIGWYIYDWANSAFSTSVITVFIGPYLTEIAKNASDTAGYVYIFNIPIYHGSLFAYIISISVILQLFSLPILGAIADNAKSKKTILGLCAYIGAFATMALYFLQGDNYLFGSVLLIIANLAFGASVVVYNSFLSDLAEPERRDSVSSIGWASGYLGGGIVLALNLYLFFMKDNFGISSGHAVRISLCSAGVWWALFTIVPLLVLKTRSNTEALSIKSSIVKSIKDLAFTIKDARNHSQALLFLVAYLFYNDGVQAIIALSAQFGNQEINISIESLTFLILMIQFIAFGGSLLFNLVANKIGAKNSIIIAILMWTAVVVFAYGFLSNETEFFIMGAVIGLIMGGTQALSRSLYSQTIPPGMEAKYFSLFEVSEKGTSWMGPMLFGLSLQLTNSYRIAILSLVIFFVIGLGLLIKFKLPENEINHQH